jgi:hypothetical protein
MLGAAHLLLDCQRALVERPRPSEVALGLKQEGEVVEAPCGNLIVRAERTLQNRQCIAKKGVSLGVSPTPVEITAYPLHKGAYPLQKERPTCKLRSVTRARITKGQQMRRKSSAQWP